MWRRVEFAKALQISTCRSRISFSRSDCLPPFFMVDPSPLGMSCCREVVIVTMVSPILQIAKFLPDTNLGTRCFPIFCVHRYLYLHMGSLLHRTDLSCEHKN